MYQCPGERFLYGLFPDKPVFRAGGLCRTHLEIRARAFFNAAPVRQNIPPEILQRWRDEQTDHKTIIALLKTQSDTTLPVIKDPVRIHAVDLHEYDFLKEAAYV